MLMGYKLALVAGYRTQEPISVWPKLILALRLLLEKFFRQWILQFRIPAFRDFFHRLQLRKT